MVTSPHRNWATLSWPKFLEDYTRYRQLPYVSGAWTPPLWADGRPKPALPRSRRDQGRKVGEDLEATVTTLRTRFLPSRPSKVTQATIDRIRKAIQRRHVTIRPGCLQDLWDALLFSRAGYTCTYCGRSPFTEHHIRRSTTIELVIDHERPAHKKGSSYTFANSVVACWACNHLKSGFPRAFFEKELLSLAAAVTAKTGRAGRRTADGRMHIPR
jgi:5-methylcytosine-specific restriction endonuclease McrA